MLLPAIAIAAVVLLTGSLAVTVYVLSATPSVVAPVLGERGKRRRAALAEGGLFTWIEPDIRKVSGWLAHFDLAEKRAALDELLRRSGYVLGLTADEFMALAGAAAGVVCLLFCALTGLPFLLGLPMALLVGAMVPYFQVQEAMQARSKKVNRRLPPAIDLVSLCMGAGADFPRAVRFVVAETPDLKDPVREEFAHILQRSTTLDEAQP